MFRFYDGYHLLGMQQRAAAQPFIIVLMSENYRSELLWRLTCASPDIVTGLRRTGFTDG